MSSSKNSNAGTKFANSNLNAVLTSKSSNPSGQAGSGLGGAKLGFSGMLVLSKRPRAVAGTKLSVPLPVNLPSMKKEHAGNDPTTQLVPSNAGASSWNKASEEPSGGGAPAAAVAQPEAARQPAITATSTWASQPRHAAHGAAPSGAWQPPAPPAAAPGPAYSRPYPTERHLNPEEYPSLAATAKGAGSNSSKSGKPYEQPQDNRAWADDERAPPLGPRSSFPEWNGGPEERFMDDRYGGRYPEYSRYNGDRPTYGRPPPDYDGPMYGRDEEGLPRRYSAYPPDQGAYAQYGSGRYADGHAPPYARRGPPQYDAYGRYPDGGYDVLFPQPPPPRQPPPPPRHAADEDDDPEAKAWQEELARKMADLEKRKADERSDSVAERRSMPPGDEELSSQAESRGQSDSEQAALSARGQSWLGSARGGRPGDGDDQDHRGKRGNDRLRALEQQIAARSAVDAALKGAPPPPPPPPHGSRPTSAWKEVGREEEHGWDSDDKDVAPPPPTVLQRKSVPPLPLPAAGQCSSRPEPALTASQQHAPSPTSPT